MSKLTVYCCGGLGVSIGSKFIKNLGKVSESFAEICPVFIDTSKSDLNDAIPNDLVYLVQGLDGSGKKRDSNYQSVKECSNEILHQFPPSEVNIVIHSASGGSGSVISPVLVSELLSRDVLTIVITVGSVSSKIEISNTINTLKSYDVISKKRGLPVLVSYKENNKNSPRNKVDGEIQSTVLMLAALFSGNNRKLDMADLKNFINYHKVTSYDPKLSMIDFFSKDIIMTKGLSLISVATLVDDKTDYELDTFVEYQAVGYLPTKTEDNADGVNIDLPVHMCVIGEYFSGVVGKLEGLLKDYNENRKAVIERSITDADVDSTEDGLVL